MTDQLPEDVIAGLHRVLIWASTCGCYSLPEVDAAITLLEQQSAALKWRELEIERLTALVPEENGEFVNSLRLMMVVQKYNLPPAVMWAKPTDIKAMLPDMPRPVNIQFPPPPTTKEEGL